MQSVEVEIFGRKFRLRTDDVEKTQTIVAEINNQLSDLQILYESLDFTKLLLLLALQQQEQVLELQSQNIQLSSDLERLNLMIGKIIGEN
ncbi:MAG: cell division protein ZapA [Candidatus Cloacimonetes bacterium]|jgi:cell division protein ZapA (FtsZ GTPase activity inhibitor)|nr:cell division protein ZapA [Candidatus Cloacimonadota bacterium]HNZ06469.1 cell division protein ZapA [Candidatus Cloacimonadota bacterium]HOH78412.1 cell division protein ZapA [Candidatus Cloacimonadota bacterium]HPN40557.1 cell division protein ZapA [Candidatus Cloacimonadota bacterium]